MEASKSPDYCPYKGLQPYTDDDRVYFFGREREQRIIESNLLVTPLTILHGESGVGKSSVLMAGVLPRLKGSPEAAGAAVVFFKEWQGENFMAALKGSVAAAVRERAGGHATLDEAASFADFLSQCNRVLRGQVLLIFDQFEDFLYGYGPPQEDAAGEHFDVEFARAVNRHDVRANFLLSLREDSLSKLDRFQRRIPNLMGNLIRLEHLSQEAARDAIKKPLDKYNELHPAQRPVKIESELVEQLLDEVRVGKVTPGAEGPGAAGARESAEDRVETPYLQMVLLRLWEAESITWAAGETGKVRPLRRATLKRLGGVSSVVRTHLDDVMGRLDEVKQGRPTPLPLRRIRQVAAALFRSLVTRTGVTTTYSLEDLTEPPKLPREDVKEVLDMLSSPAVRVLRAVDSPQGQRGGPHYRVFHDVLAPAILDWRARFELGEQRRRLERQRRKLERQKKENAKATSRELAAAAVNSLTVDPERSLLLAWYATRAGYDVGQAATPEAEDALFKSLQASRVRVTMHGHESRVYGVSYDRGGERLLTASADGTARVWESATGRQLTVLRPNGAPPDKRWIYAASFSPDGEQAATAGEDGVLRFWDIRGGEQTDQLALSSKPLEALAYDRRGGKLAVAGGEGKIWVLHPPGVGDCRLLTDQHSSINGLAFSPDGKLLASVGEDTVVRLWDVKTGRLRNELKGHTGWVKSVIFNREGTLLATASHDGLARVWGVPSGEPLQTFHHGNHWVLDVDFSPDGDLLLTCDASGAATVWSLLGRPLLTLLGHGESVTGASFSPGGRWVATASNDRTVKVWEVDGEPLVLQSHYMKLTGVAFSPDGNLLATCSDDQTVKTWSADSGQVLKELKGHKAYVSAVAFHPRAQTLASVSWDQTIRLWDLASGKQVGAAEVNEHLLAVAFSPEGDRLAVSGTSRTASVWRLRARGDAVGLERQTTLGGHDLWVNHVAFSPDGDLLAATSDDKTVKVWDLSSERVRSFRWNESLQGATFCYHEGRLLLAVASHGSEVLILDASPGEDDLRLRRRLVGHTRLLHHVTSSPDGRFLATASADHTARVWDLSSENPRVTLTGHGDVVWRVAFNPDGTKLATASWDRTARVWDVQAAREELVLNCSARYPRRYQLDTGGWLYTIELGKMQELACRHLTRSFSEYECKKYLHRPDCRSIPDPRASIKENNSV